MIAPMFGIGREILETTPILPTREALVSGLARGPRILVDGTKVQATVANGWFVAWWPKQSAVNLSR